MSSVVVAMSGGVDSSVAALILAKEGHQVIGVSMQVWDYRKHDGNQSRATCCAPSDFCDARRVAAKLDVPYYVVDFERVFRDQVIDNFIETYLNGETPNPCVDCNSKVKFRELRNRALAFGSDYVATGHYARIKHTENGARLFRGADIEKDQSYFLYNLKAEELANTLFPVGEMTKEQVREIAREAGLNTADKPESQDICFVSGSVADFVVRIGGKKPQAGIFIDLAGNKLGEHEGIHNFTVGQRKGLNLGGATEPLYVLAINRNLNTITVGPKSALEKASFYVKNCNWVSPSILKDPALAGSEFTAVAQVRSRHRGELVKVKVSSDSQNATVSWSDQWAPVSPGQACVFYSLDNQELLGGGRITAN